ncbi:MAG: inositol monophosphatase [Armatimonadota bacterium]|nr:inositol monophosphatase [Armatimonadota bacterium]MDW8026451.1 inositol monophosphatase [Armatimonadota bacterium]
MAKPLPFPPHYFVRKLWELHSKLREHIVRKRSELAQESLTSVTARDGDVSFGIDVTSEELLIEFCERWSYETPFVLVAEGIPGSGWCIFPKGRSIAEAQFFLIVDPIDGTREIMYDKRSAWILSGVAPNYGEQTCLRDIVVAMQTEIPTSKQYISDVLWAIKGHGANAERHNLITGDVQKLKLQPSTATTLQHGFAMLSKFFPAGKGLLAQLEEELFRRLLGDSQIPLAFDDQYISTGGQLYELMVGHDRFNADLRPIIFEALGLSGDATPLCAHPYDLCTELIAREAGVIVTDENGRQLSARLDIRENVAWVGYANEALRRQIEPLLHELLSRLREFVRRRFA